MAIEAPPRIQPPGRFLAATSRRFYSASCSVFFVCFFFFIEAELRELQARHHERRRSIPVLIFVKRLLRSAPAAVKGVSREGRTPWRSTGPSLAAELDRADGPGCPIADFVRGHRLGERSSTRACNQIGIADEAANGRGGTPAQPYGAMGDTGAPEGEETPGAPSVLVTVAAPLEQHHSRSRVRIRLRGRDGITMLRLPEDDWRSRGGVLR